MNRRKFLTGAVAAATASTVPVVALADSHKQFSVDVGEMTAEEASWWHNEKQSVDLSAENVLPWDEIPQEIMDELNERGADFAQMYWDLHGPGNHNTQTRQMTYRESVDEKLGPVIDPVTFEPVYKTKHWSRSYFVRVNVRHVDPTKAPRANDDANNVLIIKRVLGHKYVSVLDKPA